LLGGEFWDKVCEVFEPFVGFKFMEIHIQKELAIFSQIHKIISWIHKHPFTFDQLA
jgi:hypothetical protein